MEKNSFNLILPNREDYPQNLSILEEKKQTVSYRQLIESSASAYFETNFLTRFFFKRRFQLALQLIPQKKTNLEILDAGCGIGFFLPTLSQFAKNIWAVDYAGASLQYAKFMSQKKKLKNIFFKKVDLADNLPFSDEKFDLIICLSVLEHIKALKKVIVNFKRVLKKKGVLIAGYPNEDNLLFCLFQYLEKKFWRPKVFKAQKGTKLIHVSSPKQINSEIRKNFYIEETSNINLLPKVSFYILQKCRICKE